MTANVWPDLTPLFISETTDQTDAQYDEAVRLAKAAGPWPPAAQEAAVLANAWTDDYADINAARHAGRRPDK